MAPDRSEARCIFQKCFFVGWWFVQSHWFWQVETELQNWLLLKSWLRLRLLGQRLLDCDLFLGVELLRAAKELIRLARYTVCLFDPHLRTRGALHFLPSDGGRFFVDNDIIVGLLSDWIFSVCNFFYICCRSLILVSLTLALTLLSLHRRRLLHHHHLSLSVFISQIDLI